MTDSMRMLYVTIRKQDVADVATSYAMVHKVMVDNTFHKVMVVHKVMVDTTLALILSSIYATICIKFYCLHEFNHQKFNIPKLHPNIGILSIG